MSVSVEITKGKETRNEIDKLKRELRRKVAIANKRLTRLEKNDLTKLPAYRQWREYGGGKKFSSAGSDYNELQSELARVDRFINARTSLVRESNKYLKEIADMTNLKYNYVSELSSKLSNFFETTSKVEQYLRQVEGSASAIGYQKIWEVVNQYVDKQDVDLENVDGIVEGLVEELGYIQIFEYSDTMWDEITTK